MKCRFGCPNPVGIWYIPEGCNCFPDTIQALCEQHFIKCHSTGPIIKIRDLIKEQEEDGRVEAP